MASSLEMGRGLFVFRGIWTGAAEMTSTENWIKPIDVDSIPRNYDPNLVEKKWRDAWESRRMYGWDSSVPRENTFVVDTPPPTASGSLHVGHVFSYTHQDIIVRYQRMRGRNIFYPVGWDDNGLPTERRVQNYFNVRCDPNLAYAPGLAVERASGKKDEPPLVVSRRNFIELCARVTAEDEVAFKELFQRLGHSIDWNEEYATIDRRSRAIAQRSFIELFAAGHIYQVESPTMWDTDFQSAVAQAEVEDRSVQGAFHDIEFAVEGGGEFVISTTRPELLAACVGVAAHPDDPRYRSLFGKHAVTPVYFARVPIFPTTLVDPEKGTGVLMVCTFGDQTDVQWWREQRLQLRQILGLDGRILSRTFGSAGWESLKPDVANANLGAIAGKTVVQARRLVVEQLKDPGNSATGGGAPLKAEPRPLTHSVRFFEKGDRPLEYLTTRQWFVRLMDKKRRLIELGREIQWHPEYMGKRYENWTENLAVDWCISRQRYFGVPFPVWYPLDGKGIPIYGRPIVADFGAVPIDPMSATPPGYSESQRNMPNGFAGEPDVFDTWFTSSLTPQIGGRDGEPDDRMSTLFPTDIRPQAHDIIRTWAFYTIVKSMLQEGTIPWRNVIISGWVLDPDRKKMSKSKGNVVTPIGLLDSFGADAVRYWSGSARLGADTAYDEQVFKVGKRLVTKIYNAAKFVLQQSGPKGPVANPLDRAFLGDLAHVVEAATASFEKFDFAQALEAIEKFFWDGFTDNYIELVKVRARSETDLQGRASAIATLRCALNLHLRLLAPFLPFITDEAWAWTFEGGTRPSIHLERWPTVAEVKTAGGTPGSDVFRAACAAIAAVRKAKTEAGVSLGTRVSALKLEGDAGTLTALKEALEDVLAAAGATSTVLVERASSGPLTAQLTPEPRQPGD